MRVRALASAAPLLALALIGCEAPPAQVAQATTRAPEDITILFTSDEHGWILPNADKGQIRGGAAEMLGLWVAVEGHCPGPPSPPCKDPRTLALSGGDNYTGPAISTYFNGQPMAEAFARMGYAAAAFGNHELDFGRIKFEENRAASGMVYLAANLRAPDSVPASMHLPASAVFDRRGIKVGVVGLATDTTLRAAMAKRFEGITFEAEEPALERAVKEAWAKGPDLVVAIAHECPDVLAPIVARHPEWKLSFVGAGHCHKLIDVRAGGVPMIAPGWRLDHYARVRVHTDAGKPAGQRILGVETAVVDMSRPEGAAATAPPDPVIARAAEAWKAKVDQVLGERIGFSASGIDKESKAMGRWIAGAIRAETGADVAVVNAHGLRQNLPRGPVTKASVWSILPFDNRVMVVRLDGAALRDNLVVKGAVFAGATRGDDGSFALADGRAIDPKALYTVATLDFLYFGGDHFTFQERALAVDEAKSGADWRDLVIAWTKARSSSEGAPLEAALP